MNSVNLVGRLTKDPESRQAGTSTIAAFNIALDAGRKDESGNRTSYFFDVQCWNQTADFVMKYFAKGRLVSVSGELQQQRWDAQDGTKRSKVLINAQRVWGLDKAPVVATEDPYNED